VGWVGFRNDEEGRRCLDWWVEATLEWCFDRVEDGKFADQGYLDSFTDQTARLRVIANPGVDLAPWNLARHTVRSVRSQAIVDGVPAVCFHFHGIWKRGDRYYWKNFRYHARTTSVVREVLFAPYLRELSRVAGEVQPYVADARHRGRAAGVRSRLKTVLARLVGDSLFVSQAR
jgi:hypothetical protein